MKRLLEFLQDTNGDFSSTRLFIFLLVINATIDYQHAIWTTGVWMPTIEVLGFISIAFGLKVYEKIKTK